MKIDGRQIAAEIKEELSIRFSFLKKKNIIPHLAVILIGTDSSSAAYVRQKQKVGEEIGVRVTLHSLSSHSKLNKLIQLVQSLNFNPAIHGIIIQRPVPINIDEDELNKLVFPEKDIDAFHPHSPFTPPISLAVLKILDSIYKYLAKPKVPISETSLPSKISDTTLLRHYATYDPNDKGPRVSEKFGTEDLHTKKYTDLSKIGGGLITWLKTKKFLIIGRGETGGKPIADTFGKINIPFKIAHSKTNNLKELCLSSDIIISAVGKSDIVRRDMITNKTILIGIGLHMEDKELKPDYDDKEITDKVAFYTPVPGGVGPVNVACLFANLLSAAELSLRVSNK